VGHVISLIVFVAATVSGIVTLLSARYHRQRFQLLATTKATSLADALDGDPEQPVTIRAPTLRYGNQQLLAPASQRPCVWWAMQIRTHKRITWAVRYAPGAVLTISSPHPFQLTDGARTIQVDPIELVIYGHPHGFSCSEQMRLWDHTPPIVERLSRLRPDLADALQVGTRQLDYTEWLIKEGEEVTITGRLDTDPDTGDALLRAYTPPGHFKPVFHLTTQPDHTDVTELRNKVSRKATAAQVWLLFLVGACAIGILFLFMPRL